MMSATNRIKLKRSASAPPELEPPLRKFFIKREAFTTTPSPILATPPPAIISPIIAVKTLPGGIYGDVLVFLEQGHIYRVDAAALKRSSSWMYDKLAQKLENDQNSSADGELLSGALGSASLAGIVAYFILPTRSNKVLKRVPKDEFLPLLSGRSTSIALGTVVKTEPGEKLSPMNAPEASEPSQQPEQNPQIIQSYILLLHLMHGSALPTFNQPFQLTMAAIQKLIDLCG